MENSSPNLTDSTSLIVGASGKVGSAILAAHLRAGATVITPSHEAGLEKIVAGLPQDASGTHLPILADTYTPEGIEALAEKIKAQFGNVDNVVTSVGGWFGGVPVTETSVEQWTQFYVGPVTAHYLLAAKMIPLIRAKGSYTLIQGATAHGSIPTMSLMAMQGAAVNTLLGALISEADGKVRINGLALHRLRSAEQAGDGSLSASDVGHAATYLATSVVSGKRIELANTSELDRFIGKATI